MIGKMSHTKMRYRDRGREEEIKKWQKNCESPDFFSPFAFCSLFYLHIKSVTKKNGNVILDLYASISLNELKGK